MQCPACGTDSPVSAFGDPLMCPECGASYEKALAYSQSRSTGHTAGAVRAAPVGEDARPTINAVPLDKIPAYIKGSLSRGELVEAVFKLHWLYWVGVWIMALLAPFTVGVTGVVALLMWLNIRFQEQGLTNKRVIVKRGIISRRTEEMKLNSIETVELQQGIGGRIFGYGNVKITGRGISNVVFRGVSDPMDVKRLIEGVSHPMH